MSRLRALILIIAFALTACAGLNPATRATRTAVPAPAVTPVIAAHNIQLLVFPEDNDQQLFTRIAGARKRVLMTMYLITDLRIVDALAAAKGRGADVRALVEPNVFGSADSNKAALDKLTAAGIETRRSSPAFRLTHQKSFVVDDTAIILTPNITRSAFKSNREFGSIHGDAADVNDMVAQFDADWNRTQFQPRSEQLVWSPNNSRARWVALIRSAKTSLALYAETAADRGIALELVSAAKRGVAVRLMISPDKDPAKDPNKEGLDELQRGAVKVRYLKSHFVHAKIIVSDDAMAFLGSVNISSASLDLNRELGLMFDDREAVLRVMKTFENDWSRAVDR